MKKPKLIRSRIIHDVRAPESDLNGQWHTGWRLPDSETVAFYYKGEWWASNPDNERVIGPFETKEKALRA